MLSAPIWYMNYRVELKLEGLRNDHMERVTAGSMILGLRSQGPSLSVITHEAKTTFTKPEEIDFYVSNYANWISGLNLDEAKSDEENQAAITRVFMENVKAFEHYHWEFSGPSSVGGTERGSASGAGTVQHTNSPALELDAAKRTFKLLFACLAFTDSVTSLNAVTGFEEFGIGTVHYHRNPIEKGLRDSDQALTSIEPPYGTPPSGFIEGKLPEKFGNISYSSVHTVSSYGQRHGTLTLQVALSPNPPEKVELIVEPPADLAKWRPIGGEDETIAGDFIPIKVRLQKPGGGVPKTKVTRFKYQLLDTSSEKGVCMNWPRQPASPQPRDLQFEPGQNGGLTIGDSERQSASQVGGMMTAGGVVISCFDYGASGRFIAEAELEDGRTILGVVQGTQLEYLNLPARANDSRIASVFLQDHGATGLKDDDDSENDPVGDGFKGDGLTLYEEYRGFKHGDGWVTGDPKTKDVFVINGLRGMRQVLRGIALFEVVTRFNVHSLLREYQVNDQRVINFNHTDAPHVVDQHVIRIRAERKMSEGADAARVEKIGTPGIARSVLIPPDWPVFSTTHGRTYEYFAATLAHEMLHDCNVYHHGEVDKIVEWQYVPGSPAQVVESDYGPITVMDENGQVITPDQGFPDPAHLSKRKVWIGIDQGQHSGDEDCLMRYDCAFAYRAKTDPSVRYLARGESTGMGFCVTAAGTGVNASSHRPQSRYSSTAPPGVGVEDQRGKCKFQLRVNDLGESPKR